MRHAERIDAYAAHRCRAPWEQFRELQREGQGLLRQFLVGGAIEGPDAFLGTRRTKDTQRPAARLLVRVLQKQVRQAREMIAVQVTEGDPIDEIRVDAV